MAESEDHQTIAISGVSDELLKEIDKLAEAEDRSRSSFVRKELEQILALRKKAAAPKK